MLASSPPRLAGCCGGGSVVARPNARTRSNGARHRSRPSSSCIIPTPASQRLRSPRFAGPRLDRAGRVWYCMADVCRGRPPPMFDDPARNLFVLVVIVFLGWFALGTQLNVRRGNAVLRWLQE